MDAYVWVERSDGIMPPGDSYCPTRDVLQARIDSLLNVLEQRGWPPERATLTAAVIGELGNNAFDHNIGQWRDIPGCWLSLFFDDAQCVISIADRGQGIRQSLQRVLPELASDHDALNVALTQRGVTGRAPERRGNGLKFVMASLSTIATKQFIMHSGVARVTLTQAHDGMDIAQSIADAPRIDGTYIELIIRKTYAD